MRVQTFIGKLSLESLKLMDEHINHWLDKNQIAPKTIQQVFGYERHHHGSEEQEPVLITSIWY